VRVPTIRPAGAADVPALAALAARTWSDAFGGGASPEDQAAELAEGRSEAFFAAALNEKTTLVADAGGIVVGYVQFGDVSIPEVDARPGDVSLRRLYVETELQGRGLGRTLLEAALRHPRLAAAPRIFLQVWEENARAVRLYESVGFRTIGTTRFTVGAEELKTSSWCSTGARPRASGARAASRCDARGGRS
jgi:diamine N-acetyltransferase